MRTHVAATAFALSSAILCSTHTISAEDATAPAKAMLVDSKASALSATKRAAITNVMVSFQASTGETTRTGAFLGKKTDTSSSLVMPAMEPKLLAEIVDEIYAQLRRDLTAGGFEVLPETAVIQSENYQKMLKLSGFANFSRCGNIEGDVMLVGASGLKPYIAFSPEGGSFASPKKSLIKDWIGADCTALIRSSYYAYDLPGAEVALAKELNAHIVKATYIVTIGSTKAESSNFVLRGIDDRQSDVIATREQREKKADKLVTTYDVKAFAQVGLRAEHSRIAFRTPDGNSKGQSRSLARPDPAKDGDVVVTLAEPLKGGTEFFALAAPEQKTGGLFSGFGTGADMQFSFTASISDATAYRAEVVGMIKSAQRDMLTLIKQ